MPKSLITDEETYCIKSINPKIIVCIGKRKQRFEKEELTTEIIWSRKREKYETQTWCWPFGLQKRNGK